jgi:hypothetical protein
MVRLAGFRYRDHPTTEAVGLRVPPAGRRLARNLVSSATGAFTTIPNHPGDMPKGTLRAILKPAGIDVQEFLND